jgi:hypothetical protein
MDFVALGFCAKNGFVKRAEPQDIIGDEAHIGEVVVHGSFSFAIGVYKSNKTQSIAQALKHKM